MLNRVLLALFVSFSLILVIWQAFSSANEKEAAERRVLQAARNEAEMQLALAQAEHDYREAHAIASEHRSRLASVSHDLKQPIAALRMAIDHLQRTRSGQQLDKLDRAADYIESLSRAYLSETGANNVEGANEACGDRTKVAVDTRVFAETLRQMFEDDAQQQHIAYKVVCSGHWVNVEPLMAMRAMTNLISNAVMHAQASRILVVFRGQGNKVLFQVFDDGCGMDEQQLEKATLSGHKSETSTGQGLGLEIVQALCHHQDMHFTLRSRPGRGTCATIVIEKSASPDARDEHGNPQLS